MKKRVISLLLAIVMLAALTACGNDSDRIAQLEAENAALKAQVADLTAKLESGATSASLSDWSFAAYAWSSNNGASVTFTGTPVSYAEGQTARFSAWLEGELVAEEDCTWDGTNFVGTLDLNAADGYCYYCTITDEAGNAMEVELNTPKKPTNETLIDMETSLNSYCGMMVEDSQLEGTTLTIVSGYAQVQLPKIGQTVDPVTCTGGRLVLEHSGQEVARRDLTLVPGETSDRYAAEIAGIQFTIPSMKDDEQLDIRMEVTLSDGQVLTTAGGSWFYNGGKLFLVVG